MDTKEFEGKVALVTGGSSGIGEACARSLADAGAKVVVVDTNEELGSKVTRGVERTGGEAIFLRVDVSKAKEVERMVADTVSAFGRLDCAVNNAGIAGDLSPTGEYDLEAWRRVIDVNLSGVFYCMRYEIPQMLKQGGGAIVNMASILGTVAFAGTPAYTAAKHGVVGLTKTAAIDHAEQGIRVNSIGPAFIRTPMVLDKFDAPTLERIAGLHPVGRMGDSEEIAQLAAFLCSDRASFLTGGYYLADGGYTAW